MKDPFRAAEASRLLSPDSKIHILHVGSAHTKADEKRARLETRTNPRYQWVGAKPRSRAIGLMARSRALVLSSLMEGGANVVSEALACNTPVLSTHISGSIGMLGPDYPGYFPVGDTQALADLMARTEQDPRFYKRLQSAIRARRKIVNPRTERASWRALLKELYQ